MRAVAQKAKQMNMKSVEETAADSTETSRETSQMADLVWVQGSHH